MSIGDRKIFEMVQSYLKSRQLEIQQITEEQNCDKITVRSGTQIAYVSVYNSGNIVIGGKDSPLREALHTMKANIDKRTSFSDEELPFEIERFPDVIRRRVPECDSVIITFIEEAIRCYRNDAILGTAFMLGAASEKAINLLIISYAEAITEEKHKLAFLSRTNNRLISKKYEEFVNSYKSCKSRPSDPVLSQDLDVVIGIMFQFCRVTRNEVGHPQIVPDLDKGAVLANLGNFVTYINRIYGLIRHFKENGVVL